MESGLEELALEVLVKYVVREKEYKEALAVIDKFKSNPIASKVLRNYYEVLPEAREEMVCDLRVIAEKQGLFLFGLKTVEKQYLYLGSSEETHFIGDYDKGIQDEDMLLFFGFKDGKDYLDKLPASFEMLNEPAVEEKKKICVVCGVAEGETHIFGCPVEQCPWCDGQLNRCNCRFDQLGVEEIENNEQLETFEELLEQKGRVVFQAEQSPAYPIAGNDPGPEKK